MASESAGASSDREQGHRNHFQLLQEGLSWSGREPNTLFQNRGDGTFDEVGNVLGVYLRLDSRGAAAADLDGDGDLDLVVYNRNNPTLKIFRNDTPGQGNVALVDLEGVTSEPLASGAQAITTCGDQKVLRQVELGAGFLSQAPPTLHFGLGGCAEIESLEVQWPSGERQVWKRLPVNQHITLEEGSEGFEARELRRRNYNRNDLAPPAGGLSAQRPELEFARLEEGDESLVLADLDGKTAVLNFWATWCTACVSELPDLEALSQHFKNRVQFVGIALDEDRPREAVRAFLEERGVTYDQVWGSVEQQQPFSSLGSSPPGSIPLTAVVHKGVVRDVQVGRIESGEIKELLENLLAEGNVTAGP